MNILVSSFLQSYYFASDQYQYYGRWPFLCQLWKILIKTIVSATGSSGSDKKLAKKSAAEALLKKIYGPGGPGTTVFPKANNEKKKKSQDEYEAKLRDIYGWSAPSPTPHNIATTDSSLLQATMQVNEM